MKKIIPAISLLLVTAVLLGTSTYAWFTLNKTVTASGMAVKASSTGNILIALPTSDDTAPAVSDFTTSVNFNMPLADDPDDSTKKLTTLNPVSTSNLTNWYTATAASVSATAKKSDATYSSTTSGFLSKKFYLWSGSAADVYMNTLTVKVGSTTVSTDGTMWDALRVGVKIDDTFCIYALDACTADGSKVKAAGLEDTTAKTGTEANAIAVKADGSATAVLNPTGDDEAKIFHVIASTTAGNKDYTCGSLTAETVTESMVYVWFEGEDGACFSNNFKGDTISIGFTLQDAKVTE